MERHVGSQGLGQTFQNAGTEGARLRMGSNLVLDLMEYSPAVITECREPISEANPVGLDKLSGNCRRCISAHNDR